MWHGLPARENTAKMAVLLGIHFLSINVNRTLITWQQHGSLCFTTGVMYNHIYTVVLLSRYRSAIDAKGKAIS
jgi:hypothetical protein